MKTILILAIVAVACLSTVQSKDLVVGSSYNNRLVWQRKVEYNRIPLKKRVKEWSFPGVGDQLIKGVVARDLKNSKAEATIIAGGPGFSFVTIRLKSERGSAINYEMSIYV